MQRLAGPIPNCLLNYGIFCSCVDHFLNDVLTSGGSLLVRLALGADSRVSQEALSCILGITKTRTYHLAGLVLLKSSFFTEFLFDSGGPGSIPVTGPRQRSRSGHIS